MHITLDTLKTHRFPGHGEITVDWAGGLLHTQVRGPFNFEMVQQGMRLIGSLGTELWPADGLVVELVEWHDSMLMPPEALRYVEDKLARFAATGRTPLCTLSVVPAEIEARWLMLPRIKAIWERSRPVEVFETLAPALARASELLAQHRGHLAG